MSGYPLSMVHPHYKVGTAKALPGFDPVSGRPVTDYQGTPDVYPPMTVNTPDQEGRARAQGYLAAGEPVPGVAAYAEYPLMMAHPDHVPAVPDEVTAHRDEKTNALTTAVVKGKPEVMPHVTVSTPAEEEAARGRGYDRMGKADAQAVERTRSAPGGLDYKGDEYPKMVDGVLVQAPHTGPKPGEYPKWLRTGTDRNGDPEGVTVNGPEDENAARQKHGLPGLPAAADAIIALVATEKAAAPARHDRAEPDQFPVEGCATGMPAEPPTAPAPQSRQQKAAETKRRRAAEAAAQADAA